MPPAPTPQAHLITLLTDEFTVPGPITATTTYDSLDLDSLVLVELAVILSRHYKIDISAEELAHAGNIDATARLLRNKRTN
ncbi:acyl carrier protein [Streptomyces sp. TLI_053]|uniref:acyl carrier protein n=1 Tax=Streptomyces sp. TLI_053 TaxID=1855352 RepID=UPI00087AD0D6|nr:acyl carrier protein [Streptomyces sp. TLI_053]SDS53764.1 acyl carrier protein [Streptomyces sp. TLI_053]